MTTVPSISAGTARRMIDAAERRAGELGAAVSIAVVDRGGNVIALLRLDGATFLASTIATNKAITAAGLGVPTGDFAMFAADDPALLAGISNQPHAAAFPGGFPVLTGDGPAGGIGVAGGRTAEEDLAVAQAGLAAVPAAA